MGSLLLVLGLFTRWVAAAIIVYYLVSAFIYLGGSGQIFMDFVANVLPTMAPYIAIFFIGGGIYSLDAKFFHKHHTHS